MNLTKLAACAKILLAREKSYYGNKPLSATLNLTYRCNLKCQMCEIWSWHAKMQAEELSFDEVKRVIDELVKLKIPVVNLIGGEPLLRKDIVDIIKIVKKNGLFCDLTTNGTLINEKIADALVTQKVDHVVISVDAPDERHDEIRGLKGTLERIKQGVKLINACKRNHHSDFPRLTINTTVSALNVDLLEKMAPFSEELQADSLCFTCLNEVKREVIEHTKELVRGKMNIESVFSPQGSSLLLKTDKQIHLLKEKMRQIKTQSGTGTVSVRMGLGFYQNSSYLKEGRFPVRKCYTIHNRILIDPYGQVYPCYPLQNHIYGNVKHNLLEDIWNNEKAYATRKKIHHSLLPICHYCGCHFDRNMPAKGFVKWFLKEPQGSLGNLKN